MSNVSNNVDAAIIIRDMVKADIEQVVALEKEIFSDPWPTSVFIDTMHSTGVGAQVAECDGVMAGYSCFLLDKDYAHLTNIAVAPVWRRKSVAKRLLESILQHATEGGCEYVILEVRPGNSEARAFYEKHGFSLLYVKPNYYRQPVEDALVLARFLDPRKD